MPPRRQSPRERTSMDAKLVVQNTLINAVPKDSDEVIPRTRSEPYPSGRPSELCVDMSEEGGQGPDLVVHSAPQDDHPLAWLTPTPPPSPRQMGTWYGEPREAPEDVTTLAFVEAPVEASAGAPQGGAGAAGAPTDGPDGEAIEGCAASAKPGWRTSLRSLRGKGGLCGGSALGRTPTATLAFSSESTVASGRGRSASPNVILSEPLGCQVPLPASPVFCGMVPVAVPVGSGVGGGVVAPVMVPAEALLAAETPALTAEAPLVAGATLPEASAAMPAAALSATLAATLPAALGPAAGAVPLPVAALPPQWPGQMAVAVPFPGVTVAIMNCGASRAAGSEYWEGTAATAPEPHRRGQRGLTSLSSRPSRATRLTTSDLSSSRPDRAAQRTGRPRGGGVVTAREQPSSQGPAFGRLHKLHRDAQDSGIVNEDSRTFTKQSYHGRLSVITEDQVHSSGVLRYAITFASGELSSADGVGFVFSDRLPCPKNIQKLVSIFVNRTGRICMRALSNVVRYDVGVKQLEVGDWVELTVDLDGRIAEFTVWDAEDGSSSSASFAFGAALKQMEHAMSNLPQASCGYVACVVKNVGVTVALGS
ncbi:unnamed protein product [Prorocentrum cordatum]|uniref:Uncharacterized protein n=1 Tax=Prorocentrum cordatum TaxID=2364126 RepID=A0ABN9TQQ2_9DINO|nr:unnamed protein product [Polarella glacialis]